jgi:uncharacterized membrane protein
MRARWLWPGIVVVSGTALVAVIAAGVGAPWRTILALWFVLTCPGASLVGAFGLRDRLAEVVVVAPLSLGLVTLTSLCLFYGHAWSPDAEFVLLFGLCLAGLAWSLRGSRGAVRDGVKGGP